MKKKLLSVLLVLLTVLNAFPFISAYADEVSYSGSDFSTNATIAARLDEIFAEYVPGKHYFVSDGGNNLNGDKNLPCTAYGNGCGYFSYSWQCLGYVRWAQNKLLGCDEWANSLFGELSGYSYATEANCKKWFQSNKDKLHPGAHIRFANHSILYLAQDSDGVTFLHCNWGKTCMVKFATLSWADFASLFGYVNYCTYYINYYTVFPENGTATSKSPGIYRTVVPNSTLNFRAEPTTTSAVLDSIYDNTELVVTKIQGNWGNTVYNGVSGWISLDFAELVEPFTYNVEYVSDTEITPSSVTFGGTIIVEDNNDQNGNYSFNGWTVKRSSDNKWYTDNGWFSDEELNNNGYSKALFTSGDRIVINENWIDDVTKNETFTFYPDWSEVKLGIYKVVTPNSTLNLRAEPTTLSDVLDSIPDNTQLEITKVDSGWGYTTYNNIKGWVSLNFVEFVSESVCIESLSITTQPTKTRYYIGEKFNARGMTVVANYSDGSQKTITDYSYTSTYFHTAGKNDIVINYGGKTATVTVDVLANPEVKLLNAYGICGSNVTIPVTVTADSYIENGELVISYDNSVLEFTDYTIGELLKNADITVDGTYTAEKIKITFSSDSPIVSGDVLLNLNFKIKALTQSTSVCVSGINLYTTNGSVVPSSYSDSTVKIFEEVSDYETLFKNISYEIDGEYIVFTVVTPAAELNRVKVTYADDKSGYIKYTDSYVVNSDGNYVWTLKITCPESTTQYSFDARNYKTGKYLKEYYDYTVSLANSGTFKSVSAEISGNKTIFTVITKAGNYSRLRVGLSEGLTDNLAVSSTYRVLDNGDFSWTISIPSQSEGTLLYFDLRDGETNKYIKKHYEYEIDFMEDVINSVSAVKKDDKIVFTVVTEAGNYSRLRVGLNKTLTDNLAVSTKYTLDNSGKYIWSVTIDLPDENTVLYFDLRNAETNKYLNNHYEYLLDVSMFSDDIIKSVEAKESNGKTIFTVVTESGNYSRLRVGTNTTLAGNLAVSTKYTVNSVGNYVWSITITTPAENTRLYFDLRDAETNKYICQHYIYDLEI